MTNLSNIVEKLMEARQLLDQGMKPVLEQLKNTNLPLSERWDAYTKLVENNLLVRNDIYGDGEFSGFQPEISLYDDFYIDRFQTTNYVKIYERIMEADHNETLVEFREKNLTAWQEKVLASGCSSFTYDW